MPCTLHLFLERIEVVEETDDPGVDEAYAIALSWGTHVLDPKLRKWPPSGDVEIEQGPGAARPTTPQKLAEITADSSGFINFTSLIEVWESDAANVDRALRHLIAKGLAAGAQFPIAPPGILEALAGVVQEGLDLLLDVVGIGDDRMAEIEIGANDRLIPPTRPLKELAWSPPWDIATPTLTTGRRLQDRGPNAVRFIVPTEAHGGKWEIWILAQRTCQGEDAVVAPPEDEEENAAHGHGH